MSIILKDRLLFSNIRGILSGEGTKAHWDKSPLGQKPNGQNHTGQNHTANFGRVDKRPLL